MASAAVQRRVGRYEIVREVGRGGTAVVYVARDLQRDVDVLVPQVPRDVGEPRAKEKDVNPGTVARKSVQKVQKHAAVVRARA